MTKRRFTCENCGKRYRAKNTEAEVNREFLAAFPQPVGRIVSVCDDCYTHLMERARQSVTLLCVRCERRMRVERITQICVPCAKAGASANIAEAKWGMSGA